ncbi:unnamed protein product [Symbiodinium sp. CCMP2592]|nr:unnamed protein product [Symbiodinium sp. CCMP2592]
MAVVCDIPGVLLKGAFPMSSIDVRVLPGRRCYDAEVEAIVEDHWQATLRQKPQLFDGVVWCLVSYKVCMGEVAPCLLLEMQETSFKYVIYTHLSDAGKQMDAARRSGACGLMALTETADGLLVFGQRSQYVGAFPGYFHCELKEEVGVVWAGVSRCEFYALLDTGAEQGHKYEFVLYLRLALSASDVFRLYQSAIDKKEHEAFLFLQPGSNTARPVAPTGLPVVSVDDFLSGGYLITDVARRALQLFHAEDYKT